MSFKLYDILTIDIYSYIMLPVNLMLDLFIYSINMYVK